MSAAKKTQQDDIHIIQARKLNIIRQDRISASEDEIFVSIGTSKYQVLDFSPFGVALFSDIEPSAEQVEGAFIVQNVDIGAIVLKKIRSEQFVIGKSSGFKTAFSVIGDPISIERTFAVRDTNKALEHHILGLGDQALPEELRLITYEVKNWLSSLQDKVNSLEKSTFDHSAGYLAPYEHVVTGIVAKYIEENIYPLYEKIELIIKKQDSTKIKKCLSYFRDSIGEYMFQSSYANRAYTKPRGYAGDFEMMNTVYKSENRGETLFARCMERYFVDVPEGKAVRNRGRYLFEKITNKINSQKGKTKILSLACGPAMEVQYLIQEKAHLLNSDLEFHFIDQDIEALKECQKQLETLRLKYKFKSKFFYHNQAIKNIIESGIEENNFDLIYSAGLFDYLSDAVAQYAANQLFKGIKKGGQVIVGNFDVKAPNRFGLSLVTDWNLIYRSEADLHRLFDPIAKIKMEREDLGINLFAVFYNE